MDYTVEQLPYGAIVRCPQSSGDCIPLPNTLQTMPQPVSPFFIELTELAMVTERMSCVFVCMYVCVCVCVRAWVCVCV